MDEQKKEKKYFQWHSAFYAGIQIELEKESECLIFENEHQLSTKPTGIDVLIIKKNSKIQIQKNIGRIFRTHNIIEYKSPDDYLSIDDFYKVYGYCCFYKSDTSQADLIKAEELTISFVCSKYPRKLIAHLRKLRYYKVECVEKGIYHVLGDYFPIQIIVATKLGKKENLWLKSLADKIKETSMVEELLESYKGNSKNPLYKSVMNIIIRANKEKFEEVRMGMCEALEELMADEIEERVRLATEKVIKDVEEKVRRIGEEKGRRIGEEKGKEIGKEIGTKLVNDLIIKLLEQNRFDDIAKSARDQVYQKELFKEFGL